MRIIVFQNESDYAPSPYEAEVFQKAIGYASTWGTVSGRLNYVEITILHDGDIVAAYYLNRDEAADSPKFVMRGIRNPDDHYGFHS